MDELTAEQAASQSVTRLETAFRQLMSDKKLAAEFRQAWDKELAKTARLEEHPEMLRQLTAAHEAANSLTREYDTYLAISSGLEKILSPKTVEYEENLAQSDSFVNDITADRRNLREEIAKLHGTIYQLTYKSSQRIQDLKRDTTKVRNAFITVRYYYLTLLSDFRIVRQKHVSDTAIMNDLKTNQSTLQAEIEKFQAKLSAEKAYSVYLKQELNTVQDILPTATLALVNTLIALKRSQKDIAQLKISSAKTEKKQVIKIAELTCKIDLGF